MAGPASPRTRTLPDKLSEGVPHPSLQPQGPPVPFLQCSLSTPGWWGPHKRSSKGLDFSNGFQVLLKLAFHINSTGGLYPVGSLHKWGWRELPRAKNLLGDLSSSPCLWD